MKSNKNKKLKDVSLIPSTIRRRVSPEDLEEAFQDSLDDAIESAYDSKSVFWRVRNSKRWWVFSKWVIDDMITLLEQEFFSDDNRVYFDDGDFYYEKIRKPLIAYYKDRLEEAFYEILKNKNLMEEKKISMKKKSKYDPKKVVHKDDEHIVIYKNLDWEDEVKYDDNDVSYEDDDWMVIDLKEEDLTRIVKKVIKEGKKPTPPIEIHITNPNMFSNTADCLSHEDYANTKMKHNAKYLINVNSCSNNNIIFDYKLKSYQPCYQGTETTVPERSFKSGGSYNCNTKKFKLPVKNEMMEFEKYITKSNQNIEYFSKMCNTRRCK